MVIDYQNRFIAKLMSEPCDFEGLSVSSFRFLRLWLGFPVCLANDWQSSLLYYEHTVAETHFIKITTVLFKFLIVGLERKFSQFLKDLSLSKTARTFSRTQYFLKQVSSYLKMWHFFPCFILAFIPACHETSVRYR